MTTTRKSSLASTDKFNDPFSLANVNLETKERLGQPCFKFEFKTHRYIYIETVLSSIKLWVKNLVTNYHNNLIDTIQVKNLLTKYP